MGVSNPRFLCTLLRNPARLGHFACMENITDKDSLPVSASLLQRLREKLRRAPLWQIYQLFVIPLRVPELIASTHSNAWLRAAEPS